MSVSESMKTEGGVTVAGNVTTKTFVGRDLVIITSDDKVAEVEQLQYIDALEEDPEAENEALAVERVPLPSTQYFLTSAQVLKGFVKIVEITHKPENIQRILQAQIEQHGKDWPIQLTSSVLAANFQCIYISCWLLDVEAAGDWSCAVGRSEITKVLCTACRGSGKVFDKACSACRGIGTTDSTQTVWEQENGSCRISLKETPVPNSTFDLLLRPKTWENQVQLAQTKSLSSGMQIFLPKYLSIPAGQKYIHHYVEKKLQQAATGRASKLGNIRGLELTRITSKRVQIRNCWYLYPILIGTYVDNGKTRQIQLDGVTDDIVVELPDAVVQAQQRRLGFSILITLFVPIIVLVLVLFSCHVASR